MVIQRQINRIYRLIQILGKPYFIVTVIFLICSCNRKIIESNSSYIYDNVNDTSKFKKLNELKITFLNDYCYVYEMHYYGCSYHKAKYKVIFRNIILFKVESVGNNSYYSFYETYNPKNKDSIVIKSSWIDKYDTIPLSSIDLLISSDTMILLKSSSKGILLLKNDTGIKKISIKIFNEITEFQKESRILMIFQLITSLVPTQIAIINVL